MSASAFSGLPGTHDLHASSRGEQAAPDSGSGLRSVESQPGPEADAQVRLILLELASYWPPERALMLCCRRPCASASSSWRGRSASRPPGRSCCRGCWTLCRWVCRRCSLPACRRGQLSHWRHALQTEEPAVKARPYDQVHHPDPPDLAAWPEEYSSAYTNHIAGLRAILLDPDTRPAALFAQYKVGPAASPPDPCCRPALLAVTRMPASWNAQATKGYATGGAHDAQILWGACRMVTI